MDNETVPVIPWFYSKYTPYLPKTSFAKLDRLRSSQAYLGICMI